MPKFSKTIDTYPARVLLVCYLLLVAIGSALLMLPVCSADPKLPIQWHEAIFTAVSAACVTGLSVRSTPTDFSVWGQLVILLLFQVGGIGIMTITTYLIVLWDERREDFRSQVLVKGTLGGDRHSNLKSILAEVIWLTLIVESVGWVLFTVGSYGDDTWSMVMWRALFHSVSAFCNAGFSLHDDSFVRYRTDSLMNGTAAGLIILGGIGFPVISDLRHRIRKYGLLDYDCVRQLSLHSKLMLLGSGMLIVLGTLVFLLLEMDGVLRGMSWWDRLQIATFHAVSCRTAGFNSVDLAKLTNAMLFFSILLMAIGAGPASTAGGFKVSTMMVLLCQAWSSFSGYSRISIFRRTIPQKSVTQATSTAMFFGVIAVVALLTLVIFEQSHISHDETDGRFLDAVFEVVSALGTVGLSTGITSTLSFAGRWIIILLMFMGRLGPISVFVAISLDRNERHFEYASEEPMIG